MKVKDIFQIVGNGAMYGLTAMQTKEVFEIISLILSILISIVILVSKMVEWIKEAKKDGKIDEDELKQGLDIMQDGLEDIKQNVDKKENKK